ncbi:MAG: pyridoxal phosphate-dependent aminotransferase [Candidatus Thermoplasmatota archaeon]|nr:pyridoxal phosphate-dependent aminotransferase [Candidatus Thermoplasmatota archaeon]MCL5254012.1 pyridoxal phosphate-dependent aminotransferase [Candidatus Thermoplasmatota archaeon]
MPGRMENIIESGTVKVADKVKELKSRGLDVTSFSIGEPDFPTPQHIVDACIEALKSGFTKYTASAGIPELREAISQKLKAENGIDAESSEIVVTPTKQALFMAVLALVDRNMEVIVPDPSWVSYEPMVRIAEGIPVPVRADEETGFRLTPELVAEKITEKTRMIILNSPNNPTGAVAWKEDIEGLCDLAREHDLLILSDEIYEKIIYDAVNYSPGSFPGMKERVITVNGFSKTYSMTGWRLGYLHADKRLLKDILKIQTHSITCVTSFVQKAGVAALRGPKEPVEKMVSEFRKRRDFVVRRLREIEGMNVVEPQGAFYAFPKYDYEMDSESISGFLLDRAQVAVTPGSSFGKFGERHFRLSYATSMNNLEKGLDSMERALKTLRT